MKTTNELKSEAENLAKGLREALFNLKKKALDKSSVIELETALLSTIKKLPDNAEEIVYTYFVHFLTSEFTSEYDTDIKTSGTKALERLKTKAALIAKAKEIIELAKYNQNRLSLLTEPHPPKPDSKKPNSVEKHFDKIYYHGSSGKRNSDVSTNIGLMEVVKQTVSKHECSLDHLQTSDIHVLVDNAFSRLNKSIYEQSKCIVIDPLLTTQDPIKSADEKALLTALLKQHEDAIKHPSILRRVGQFFRWSAPRKIEAGKTYTVKVPDALSRQIIKRKVRLTNDILIQHEAIYNPHTMQNDLSPRFRIISNQRRLGKGKHGKTRASAGTIKLRPDGLESKLKSSLVIKEMHQHLKVILIRDTPGAVQDEVNFLRKLTAKAKSVVFQKRTIISADSYVIDERFYGVKLADIIKEQTEAPDKSKDIDWLTKVTSNLLYNLKQIHSLNFIHHDVWPDNIMVNDAADARIIDLGSGMNTDNFIQYGGRHEYRPPEKNLIAIPLIGLSLSFAPFRLFGFLRLFGLFHLFGPFGPIVNPSIFVDQSSDIYMLGKSLVELWSTNKEVRKDPTVNKLFTALETLQKIHKKHSFAIMREDQKAREALEEMIGEIYRDPKPRTPIAEMVLKLATMMHSDKKYRPELESVINKLEEIGTKGASPPKVGDAFTHALNTHTKLLLEASKSPSISKLGDTLNAAIDNALLDNSADAIEKFVQTIRIKVFVNANKKDDLKKITNDIIKAYSLNKQTLLNLHNQVSASLKVAKLLPDSDKKTVDAHLIPLLDDLNHRIHKSECPMTLDDLNAFNEKMTREEHLTKLNTRLDDFVTKHRPAIISTQCEILRRLSLEPIDATQADKVKLKNAVKFAMHSYMQNDYADKTKPKLERLNEIKKVLDVLEKAGPVKTADELDKLEGEVKGALGKLSLFTRGSKLHRNVNNALNTYKRRAL